MTGSMSVRMNIVQSHESIERLAPVNGHKHTV